MEGRPHELNLSTTNLSTFFELLLTGPVNKFSSPPTLTYISLGSGTLRGLGHGAKPAGDGATCLPSPSKARSCSCAQNLHRPAPAQRIFPLHTILRGLIGPRVMTLAENTQLLDWFLTRKHTRKSCCHMLSCHQNQGGYRVTINLKPETKCKEGRVKCVFAFS